MSSAAGSRGIQLLGRVGDDCVEFGHIGDTGVVVRLVDDLDDLVTVETGVVLVQDDGRTEDQDEDRVDHGQTEDCRDGVDARSVALLIVHHRGVPVGEVVRLQGLQVGDDALLQGFCRASGAQVETCRALTQDLLIGLLLDPVGNFSVGGIHDDCPFDVSYLSSRHGISGIAEPILRILFRRTAISAKPDAMIVP